MQNEKKQSKKRVNVTWIAATALLFSLILYTVYHVLGSVGGNIATTPAGFTEQTETTVLEGVVFRDEDVLSSIYSGGVKYLAPDGERVSVGASLAEVYSAGTLGVLSKRLEKLQRELDILKRSNVSGVLSVTDIERLNDEISRLYLELMLCKSKGDLSRVSEIEDELLICLNKKKIYDGTVKNYNADIARVESEINIIYSSFTGTFDLIKTDVGGYFYHSCDGYESTLTLEKMSALDTGSLGELISEVKQSPQIENSEIGKLVYDYKWYLASLYSGSIEGTFEVGEYYTVTLFNEKNITLDMKLEEIREGEGGESLLIFSCLQMPDGFQFGRYQSFQITLSSVVGYRVPSEAIHRIVDKATGEEKTGVYILNASVVYFRRVEILLECDGYYIVAEQDKSLENYKEYLEINDLIIISGEDLYEGKVIEK